MALRTSTIAFSLILTAALVTFGFYWLPSDPSGEAEPEQSETSVPSGLQQDPNTKTTPESTSGSIPAPTSPVTPKLEGNVVELPVPEKTRSPVDPKRMMRFPDGTWLPSLNGVENPPVLRWMSDIPYAPVVSILRDSVGMDWWVHADGTKSTVTMTETTRMGRKGLEAVATVAHPVPVTELEPQSGVEHPPIK